MIDYLIEIEDWNVYYSEGGLCDSGVSLYINDILITNYFNTSDVKCWEALVSGLGVKNSLVTYKQIGINGK